MWHFLEHDYDPLRSLRTARTLLRPGGRLVVEVPRLDSRTFAWFGSRWPGLQAPQHTVLFDRAHLLRSSQAAGLEVVDYLPYGAFPAYFYLFTGVAFQLLRGRGLNLDRAIVSVLPRTAADARRSLLLRDAPEPRDADGGLPEGRVNRPRCARRPSSWRSAHASRGRRGRFARGRC